MDLYPFALRTPSGCLKPVVHTSDTLFANMHDVYEMLPAELQQLFDGLYVHNSNPNQFSTQRAPGDPRYLQTAIHPAVAVHPETGRKLINVSELYARRIVDVPSWQSRHLLAILFELAKQPDCQVRIRWEKGTVVMWDNRSTQHYGVSDYEGFGQRMLYRISVRGSVPKPVNQDKFDKV